MKKILLLFLLLSVQAFGEVIVLKSGRKIECESVVEQPSQIQCVMGQSTVAFQKSQVAGVTKSPVAPKTQAPPASKPEPVRPKSADETERMNKALGFTRTGISQMKKKQYDTAIQSFQDAYNLYRNKDTVSNLALAYLYSEDYDTAQSYFQELLTLHPDDVVALNALGIISAVKGDTKSADHYWRQSYAIKPDPIILTYLQSLTRPAYVNPEGSEKMALKHADMEKTIVSYGEDTEGHFHVRYDEGSVNPVLLKDIDRTLEDDYDKLRFAFEVEPSNTLEVVLYPKKDFQEITGAPDWSSGFNDGRIHLPVGGLDSVNREVEAIITHELTHTFFLTKTNGRGPVWLQEGVAQYMQGSRLGGSTNSLLVSLLRSGGFPSLNQMSSSFMGASTSQAAVYYTASLSFVQYLMNRYRFDELNDMLKKLGSGESTEDAVREAFGSRLSDLEEDWHNQLK
jgi:tetratricopeptide (TPR) repeat protein